MSSRVALNPGRKAGFCIALAFALCLLATPARAQVHQPVDEVFGGYSWLHPDGYGDLNYYVLNIVDGFAASNTYYVPAYHNLGILVDGSYHWNGGTRPGNPFTPANEGSTVGYALLGVQFKYHARTLSPFVRVFAGGASLSPDCCGGTRWSTAVGGGAGLDLTLTPRFSIRLIQADYINAQYSRIYPGDPSDQWNSVRLAAGLVFAFGNYYAPPLSCSASATPAEVWAGEPVNITATGTNFNPKHAQAYGWTTNGGKLSSTDAQSATIDTTGMAPGSYSASATITDTRLWEHNSTTCAASFAVKQPHPPEVSCSANPTTVAPNQPSTITMAANSPDGRPLTYSWTTTSGQLSSSGSTVTLTPANTDAGTTITVTGTVSDDRNPPLTANCSVQVIVPPVEKCGVIEDWGECTFSNPRKSARVDNECKDVLDSLALKFQGRPSGKLDIVGYADEQEAAKDKTLGAQRAVNVKYYLTTEGTTKLDASRIQARDGGTGGKTARFYFVPEGCLETGQVEAGSPVDESQLHPQPRSAPAKKRAHKAKPAAAPNQ